jgi:hypothetical protein
VSVRAAKRRISGRSAAESLDGHRSEGYTSRSVAPETRNTGAGEKDFLFIFCGLWFLKV